MSDISEKLKKFAKRVANYVPQRVGTMLATEAALKNKERKPSAAGKLLASENASLRQRYNAFNALMGASKRRKKDKDNDAD